MINKKDITNLPSTFGVYLFKQKNKILYVGKSINIKARVNSHIENAKLDKKEYLIVSSSDRVDFVTTESEFTALLLESKLIKEYSPKYNVIWKDNKSYLYIKITAKDEFPKIALSRKERDSKSLYFGPFSSTKIVEDLISDIRHIVPFCTQKNLSKHPCFYSKIHLCDPCPNEILTLKDKNAYNEKKLIYKKNINKVIRILQGKVKTILKGFYSDLKRLSKDEKYEEAIKLRNKIYRLERLIHYPLSKNDFPASGIKDYQESLLNLLRPYFPKLSVINRIETYDISNLGPDNATASMVVCTGGMIDKSQYRRFKIKNIRKISDFERLDETIRRRFKNDWPDPQLLVIDGGSPQVKTVIETLESIHVDIPVIGIAKNPDRLVIGNSDFTTLRPKLDDGGFNLIRLMRDEAHRFARKYHLYLRDKDFLI